MQSTRITPGRRLPESRLQKAFVRLLAQVAIFESCHLKAVLSIVLGPGFRARRNPSSRAALEQKIVVVRTWGYRVEGLWHRELEVQDTTSPPLGPHARLDRIKLIGRGNFADSIAYPPCSTPSGLLASPLTA